eukprot:CAMPEP_0184532964 /NCGR_PEP_ID=MMETSP0198_2-20121128/14472_1 /TAXON_ID=1112570 /ORGANISM="Thraustochytrium sp., Strain LLF1b" /LENGTH=74 /DNA_ID=CAMNT_0026925645 /DNA_START=55 /DNA_END=279 /DNA_ORIENTATION=-
MESDSVFIPGQDNLDLIDEEWAADSLSDDEIEISPENDLAMDEHDVDPVHSEKEEEEEEKWTDIGLETFATGSS